jgi:hypothetical protein
MRGWLFAVLTGVLVAAVASVSAGVRSGQNVLAFRDYIDQERSGTVLAGSVSVERLWPRIDRSGAVFAERFVASPRLVELPDLKPFLLASPTDGSVASLDPKSGQINWRLHLPRDPGHRLVMISSPAIVGDTAFFAYHSIDPDGERRHFMAAVDLRAGRPDPRFEVLRLTASVPANTPGKTVTFDPNTQQSRGRIAHLPSGSGPGTLYVPFSSIGDLQVWHGWLFEIDLNRWMGDPRSAIAAVFNTTPEIDCDDGAEGRICGGGIWAYAGPLLRQGDNGPEILVQTGNGRFDLSRGDYAQALLRLKPGLAFDPACDPSACRNERSTDPGPLCLSTCRNLFVPRLMPGDPPMRPASGQCDTLSYLECINEIDLDFASAAPALVRIPGRRDLIVTAGKAGDMYLLDADNLGTLYDRKQAIAVCGTPGEPCTSPSEGMIINQPQIGWIGDRPVVVIAGHNPDQVHPAGLIAFEIIGTETPSLRKLWQFPAEGTPEASTSFRIPPTRPLIWGRGADAVVWVADNTSEGRLFGVRLGDGHLVARIRTMGWPMRNAMMTIHDGVLYLHSLPGAKDTVSWIEAFRIGRTGAH